MTGTDVPDDEMTTHRRLPQRLRAYRLIEFIGSGGMGEVWLAIDLRIEKPRVLKILKPRFARDPRYRRQFFREAKIGASLRHGRIVPVLDYGEAKGHLFLVMMFIDGRNLGAFCRALAQGNRVLPIEAVGFILGEVLEALAHAHAHVDEGEIKSVIHRDVTPSNVLISSSGEVLLTDFGIARYETDLSSDPFGTLQYMAPEQTRGKSCLASDIYGVAGVLHFMLTGQAPRSVNNANELEQSLDVMPPATGRSDVPEPLERLRRMGLHPELAKRIPTTDHALEIFETWMGYRKTARTLARFYLRYVGPPRSGITGAMLAAREAAAAEGWTCGSAAAEQPQPTPSDSEKMTVKAVERKGEGPELDEAEEDEDLDWNRHWWRDERDPLESRKTRRYVSARDAIEPDAPRMLRRPHRRPLDPPVDTDPSSSEVQ